MDGPRNVAIRTDGLSLLLLDHPAGDFPACWTCIQNSGCRSNANRTFTILAQDIIKRFSHQHLQVHPIPARAGVQGKRHLR